MSLVKRTVKVLLLLGVVTAALGGGAFAFVVWLYSPDLPSIDVLKDVHLQTPLRVYSRDARLIGEFGEKRRIPLRLDEVPPAMVQAVIAAEDERFFQHPGVDWQGLVRAVAYLVRTGEKGPGGSTVTMQVARNFFLGREKTYERKLKEILLALEIERRLSKEEILELYFNKIFFGHRAYGVGAAARVYYGDSLEELNLAQIAMLAGLPKAPSRFNPIVNPQRALARRDYVLGRMRELGFIDEESYARALAAGVTAKRHGLEAEVEAPYAAEMVRAALEEEMGEDAYTGGYRVYTTIDSARQSAANRALRTGLLDYDRRHGFRGPERRLEPGEDAAANEALLADIPVFGGVPPALVLEVDEEFVLAHAKGFGEIELPWSTLEWARKYIDENRRGPAPKRPADVVEVGDVIRVLLTEEGWTMAQIPAVEGALVALDPRDGAIVALSGGFDFHRSKFNRVTQAMRQPGSSFKPFIYSAALQRGFTPASFINDAPVVFEDHGLEDTWRPENYSGRFFGPTRMRVALYKSRNLVSIRLLKSTGIERALEHLGRFGLDVTRLPANLSLAVGSGEVTPLELSAGYAVIANGGYRVEPWFIARIEDAQGEIIRRAQPKRVCRECAESPASTNAVSAEASTHPHPGEASRSPWAERSVDARNVWLMNSMMRDVVRQGTAKRALSLGRDDLAGKTGTTNDFRDAWFAGFTPGLVATAWVGFDQYQSLGRREAGSKAALPMWIEFMASALDGVPEEILERPEGLVTMRIDPESGEAALAGDAEAIFETFRAEYAPARTPTATARSAQASSAEGGVTERLF